MILHGQVVLVPNPCTTRPCLPGMALAIRATPGSGEQGLWYLVRDGAFLTDPESPPGTPPVGTLARASGVAHTHVDVNGDPYTTFETDTLNPAGP